MPKLPVSLTRRQIITVGAAVAGASLLPRWARAALNYSCNWQQAAIADPNNKARVGYVTDFDGIGLAAPLARDITVRLQYNAGQTPTYAPLAASNGTMKVTALLESIAWNGGAGDPIQLSCFMSNQNAAKVKAVTQTLTNTTVKALGFWVDSWDQMTSRWYEQFFPAKPSKLTGQISKTSPPTVDLNGAQVAATDTYLYRVVMQVLPSAGAVSTLTTATSSTIKAEKTWSL